MAVSNQTFYWAGNNRAMIAAGNSFPAGSTYGTGFSGPWGFNTYYSETFPYNATGDVYWGDAANWFIKVSGTSGGTNDGGTAGYFDYNEGSDPDAWYWAPADRIPHRGDNVIFNHVPRNDARGLTFQMPLSPCLFGGRGNSGGNMWIGDVAGGMTTGNVDAGGGLASMIVEESYWNAGRTDGKIDSTSGFRTWGMRSNLNGVSADGKAWEGINIKADGLEIDGTWLRNPKLNGDSTDNITPQHAAWINNMEDCGNVRIGMKSFDIYGGTCNNFIFDDYHRSGVTLWSNFDEGKNSVLSLGRANIQLSVLETIRLTPKLYHTRTSWYDPSGQTDKLIWGPQRVSTKGYLYYGTDRITSVESYPHAGFGATLGAFVDISMRTQQLIDNGSLGGPLEPDFWEPFILTGKEFTQMGSTGNSRIIVDSLKLYDNNPYDEDQYGAASTAYISRFMGDSIASVQGFNNTVRFSSGATISNLQILGGKVAVAGSHPGGVTWDASADDKSIRIDSTGRGPAGWIQGRNTEVDASHPYFQVYNHFIGGDPGSTAIEDGLQVLDIMATIKFAYNQYLKVAPTPYGTTAAFSQEYLETAVADRPSGGGGGIPIIP
jgi:hypothetical protein